MSYSGYDIEDSVILNRGSIDRGFGRCIVLKKFATSIRKYPNGTMDESRGPAQAEHFQKKEEDPRYKKQKSLELDGICPAGAIVEPGYVLGKNIKI